MSAPLIKWTRKNPVWIPRWIVSTTESPSLLMPLLFMGVDRIQVNSGCIDLGLLLGIAGFWVLTLNKYKRSFSVLSTEKE